MPANSAYLWNSLGVGIPILPGIKPSEVSAQEAMVIASLTLQRFHDICYWNLSQCRNFDCPAFTTVNLTTIIACASEDRLEDSVEIALLSDAEVSLGDWIAAAGATGEVMESGWTRYYDFILAL
jgi:hypothetical protein